MDLTGKVAIVTGSGRGLGLAYAEELSRRGAAVVVNDIDPDTAESAAEALRRQGGKACAVAAAVGTAEAAQSLVDTAIAEHGRLDVLVTNAGILRDKVLWKMTDEDFDQVCVHLRGTFTCVRAAAVQMRQQGSGGRIICVGSPAGQRGNFGQTNYAAAKAGILGMVRTWAMELAVRHHRQRRDPGGRHGDDRNRAVPAAPRRSAQGGKPLPAQVRRELGFGAPEDAAERCPSSPASRPGDHRASHRHRR